MNDRLKRSLRALIQLDGSSEAIARAFGLGVALGFSPLLGFHSIIALGVLVFAKLNRRAFLAGVFLNFWTLVPVAVLGTGLGMLLTGSTAVMPELSGDALLSGRLWRALSEDVRHLLVPFVLGNTVVSIVCGLAGYAVAKRLLARYRRSRSDRVTSATNA